MLMHEVKRCSGHQPRCRTLPVHCQGKLEVCRIQLDCDQVNVGRKRWERMRAVYEMGTQLPPESKGRGNYHQDTGAALQAL